MERMRSRYSVLQSSSVAGMTSGRMARVSLAAAEFDVFRAQGGGDFREEFGGDFAMDEQGFQRVADAAFLGLGVDG